MNRFINSEISEKELFELTPLNASYDAVYLCSALVLEEYRRKGITKQLCISAIENIRNDHPLEALIRFLISITMALAAKNYSNSKPYLNV